MADAAEIVDGHFFEPFAAFIELLVDLDGRFLHYGMGFLAAADKKEVFTPGQTGLPVIVVKRQPEQSGGLGTFIGCFHDVAFAESSGWYTNSTLIPNITACLPLEKTCVLFTKWTREWKVVMRISAFSSGKTV